MHIEFVPFLCSHSPIVRRNHTATCSIDCLSVLFHPLAHLLQTLYCHCRKFSVRLRTDVHQKIGILAGSLHQIMNQCFGRLIVLVGNLIPPHPIHRFTSFQRQVTYILSGEPCRILTRQVTFEDLNILTGKRRLMMIISDQTPRLELMNQSILFGQFPIKVFILILIPPAVEPDSTYGTVVCKQFRQLVIHKLIIAFPVSF